MEERCSIFFVQTTWIVMDISWDMVAISGVNCIDVIISAAFAYDK